MDEIQKLGLPEGPKKKYSDLKDALNGMEYKGVSTFNLVKSRLFEKIRRPCGFSFSWPKYFLDPLRDLGWIIYEVFSLFFPEVKNR